MGRKQGKCSICGEHGDLSFEHLPPKSAFNSDTVKIYRGLDILKKRRDPKLVKGTQSQGGAGEYTLCEQCNSKTGSWYVPALADFCKQAALLMVRSGGHPSLLYPYHIFPLRVLKQVIAMFLSCCPKLNIQSPELVRFVLDKHQTHISRRFRFFLYYNISSSTRMVGPVYQGNVQTGRATIFSEFTFPPIGYVMTEDSDPPHNRMQEITHWSDFRYPDKSQIFMKMDCLPTNSPYPGIYK